MQTFNDELIEAIRSRIPKKGEQLSFLMDTSSMGKETAYRRLRGDIPFTFSEACVIAQKLKISLDELAKIGRTDKPVFELELSPDSPIDYVLYKMDQYEQSYDFFLNTSNIIMESICNTIPYPLFFPFENLFRIYLFRIIYQTEHKKDFQSFSDFILPDDLNKRRIEMADKNQLMPEDSLIFDRNIFSAFMSQIKYFYNIGLITGEEKEIIKEELAQLLSDFEEMAIAGKKKSGTKSWIYLSNIDFDCNYCYVKGDGFERAYMDGIYLMDTISSSDPYICKFHQLWIDSLKKYSTLISISGEIERKTFFNEQKRVLNLL